jgi:cyclic pyranopterin phosphate synthase
LKLKIDRLRLHLQIQLMALTDTYGRVHDYLRISLTDKCNLRCNYCMPSETYRGLPNKHLMTAEEIISISKTFIGLGVKKIRLTGGEPLIRKDIGEILTEIGKTGCRLDITSNGIFLDKHWESLKAAGIKTLNLSIDTLRKDRFLEITKRDELDRVLQNIEKAGELGFKVKLNCVVIAGFNEDEILDFVKLTEDKAIEVRFIEFMPFNDNKWEWHKVVPMKKIMDLVETEFSFSKIEMPSNATSKNFQVEGFLGRFGVISSVTSPFCSGCNRMRLTADGKMRNCLFSKTEFDLLKVHREGGDLVEVIETCLTDKKKELGGLPKFEHEKEVLESISERSMIGIGG